MSEHAADPAARSQYRIESLAKGLQLLALFDETTTALKLREIADRAGLPMPTAFRIAATLEEEGFLERSADGLLSPGIAVLTLGSAALRGSDLVQASERPLRALAAATGETVNLGVLRGDQVLYLARLRNADLVTANIQVGSTLPAVVTSMGKVLLADLDADELTARIGATAFAGRFGPNAVATRAQLDAQLEAIRARGYAVQDEEVAPSLRSVAMAVTGPSGRPVAAVNIAVSVVRHDVDWLTGPALEHLRTAALEIGRRMSAG